MKKLGKSPITLVMAAVILLIFFHYLGPLAYLEQTIIKLSLPLQRTFYRWGRDINQLAHLKELSQENQDLKDELIRLSVDYLKLASLELENKYLRFELNFLKQEKYKYQLVNVVGRLPVNEQIVIIDQGHSAGLREGLPVIVSQGVIVGKVLNVEESKAYVELLTNTQSRLAVTMSKLSGTNGLLKGQTGSSMLMDFIPKNQEIQVGDLVISSGLEELVPAGLLVGEVSEVENQVGQIFQLAKVIPPFNYQNLQILTVILPD